MTFDTKLIADRIIEVAINKNKLPEHVAHDVAFHMTDWLQELARYSEFCANPNNLTDREVNELLLAFLTHAPNHIAAASKLYIEIPVTDVFGVGAISEENNQ